MTHTYKARGQTIFANPPSLESIEDAKKSLECSECGSGCLDCTGENNPYRQAMAEPVAVTPVKGSAAGVLLEVVLERERQDEEWGGPEHDDAHDANDWVNFIEVRAQRAWNARTGKGYRKRMVQIAALAVAAVQSFDRKA